MRPAVVIEGDEGGDALTCVRDVLEAALTVDDLGLEGAVHTLCYGVVRGFVVFRHGYPHTVLLELVRIGGGAILHAPVRVMDESPQLVGRSLRDGHAEGLQRVFRLQRVGEAPAYDLARVGIRHQVQVAASVCQVDVRDVAHPQLVRTRGHKAADEVLVLAVAVVRVRRVPGLGAALHQAEVAQQAQERVAPRDPVLMKHALHHQPELQVADARVHLADLTDGVYDAAGALDAGRFMPAALVIRLLAMAKQLAAILYRVARIAA